MDLKQLNELDLSTIGDWPLGAKAVLVAFLGLVLLGGWYWFFTQDQLDQLSRVETEETELKTTFEAKQRLASRLGAYQEQLEEIKGTLQDLLRQLPGSAEIAALLVDVSQTGLAAGLEFELFRPEAEISKSFYAEIPIKVEVIGQYHDFGYFVSGLAALPRIVTVHDINITPIDKAARDTSLPSKLRMSATVKTYRYLEDDEIKQKKESKPAMAGQGVATGAQAAKTESPKQVSSPK